MIDRLLIAAIAVSLLPLSTPGHAAPEPAPACAFSSPLTTLGKLGVGGKHVRVARTATALTMNATKDAQTLLAASCEGVALPAVTYRPQPDTRDAATTYVVRDDNGKRLYSLSATAKGATILTIEAGVLGPRGLHAIAFDNDDVYISDGQGRLVMAIQRGPDGTLSEREGAAYGCGCERVTSPDGKTVTRPLQNGR